MNLNGFLLYSLKFLYKIYFFFSIRKGTQKNERGDISERFLTEVSKVVENHSNFFISHKIRPKFLLKDYIYPETRDNRIAIILQGPVRKDDDFTLSTCKLYLSQGKKNIVILSTWNSEDDTYLEKFRKIGVIVVKSELPLVKGYLNINCQLKSTQIGIDCAIKYGANYICKTRCDQRIYGKYSIEMLVSFLDKFPPKECSLLNKRIIALSSEINGMFVPYFISDFFIFGKASDMQLLNSIPFDERPIIYRGSLTRKFIVETKSVPEIYIFKNLANLINHKYGNSIHDYWEFIKDNLILIDTSIIQLYWKKYNTRYCEHHRGGQYFIKEPDILKNGGASFCFSSWLCLISDNFEYKSEYEDFLNYPLEEFVL